MSAPPEYRKTNFKGGTSLGMGSNRKGRIWEADDHLLYQEVRGYAEESRRFFFKDIQLVSVTNTRGWLYASIACGFFSLCGLLAIAAIFLNIPSDDLWFAAPLSLICIGVPTALLGWIAIRNITRAPSCKCYIHTAVQQHEIVAVRYRRDGERFLEYTRRLCEGVQGAATPEAIAPEGAPSEIVIAAPFAEVSLQSLRGEAPKEKPPLRPLFHWITFVLLLFFALGGFVDLVWPSQTKNNIDGTLLLPYLGFLIAALVRQHRARSPMDIKIYTWLAMAMLISQFVFLFGYQIYIGVSGNALVTDAPDSVAYLQQPGVQVFIFIVSLLELGLCILAFMRLLRGVNVPLASVGVEPAAPSSPVPAPAAAAVDVPEP